MAVRAIQRLVFAPGASRADGGGGDSGAEQPAMITVTAVSTQSESPRTGIMLVAYGSIVVFAVVAFLRDGTLRDPLVLASGASAFALFYVASQAIERFLEPFSHFILPKEPIKEQEKAALKDAIDAETLEVAETKTRDAANKAAEVNLRDKERTILFWAVASDIGIVVSMVLGLYFFAAILSPADPPQVPRWFDAVVTGLVIGGGSKVVHDLIERTKKKEETPSTATP
jgi:hypothetical protein